MKVDGMFVYQIAPLDFGWGRFVHVDEYVASLVLADKETRLVEGEAEFGTSVVAFYVFLHRALKAARKAGWDGDFRDEPHVGFLPSAHEPIIFLIWKHDNNGVTFVASHVELPYLEREQ